MRFDTKKRFLMVAALMAIAMSVMACGGLDSDADDGGSSGSG